MGLPQVHREGDEAGQAGGPHNWVGCIASSCCCCATCIGWGIRALSLDFSVQQCNLHLCRATWCRIALAGTPIHVEVHEFQCQNGSCHKEMGKQAPMNRSGDGGKLLSKQLSIRLGGKLRAPLTLCYHCTETVHLRHLPRPAGVPSRMRSGRRGACVRSWRRRSGCCPSTRPARTRRACGRPSATSATRRARSRGAMPAAWPWKTCR